MCTVSLVGTLYFAFNDQAILCLVTVAVQACALVYYVASVKHTLQNLLDLRVVFGCADSVPRALLQYIPYARKLLRVGCKKCMKRYT